MVLSIIRKKHFWVIATFFCFFFAVFVLSPLTIDDTYYAFLNLKGFKEIFNFAAGYGNGRVLGNMLGIAFATHPIFSALIRSSVLSMIVYIIYRLMKVDDNSTNMMIIAVITLTIVGTNHEMFGKSLSWQSAFFNTIPSVLLMLLNLLILKSYNESKHKAVLLVCLSLSAFSGQFFSENSTVYNIVLTFFILVISLFMKKSNIAYWLNFVFSFVGGLGMLLCRMYYPLVNRDLISVKAYQQIHLGSVGEIISSCLYNGETCVTHLFKFFVLFAILSVEIIVLLSKKDFKIKSFNKFKPWVLAFAVIFPLYGILRQLFYPELYFEGMFRFIHLGLLVLFFLMYLVAIVSVYFLIENKQRRFLYAFFIAFALCTIVPLLVVEPLEIRTLTYAYFFVLLGELVVLPEVIECVPKKITENVRRIISVITVVTGIYILTVFTSATVMSRNIDQYCKAQMEQGAKEISVCALSNTKYYHYINPDVTYKFKYYYKEPGDIEFKDMDPYEWRMTCWEK